jgi:hypothetical protein
MKFLVIKLIKIENSTEMSLSDDTVIIQLTLLHSCIPMVSQIFFTLDLFV